MVNEHEKNELIKKLNPELLQLYSAPDSGNFMFSLYTKYLGNFETQKYIRFANIIGDTILGLHKTTEIPKYLTLEIGTTSEMSEKIFTELKPFLSPVAEREAKETQAAVQTAVEKKESIESLAQKLKSIEPSPEAEIHEHHESIPPLHTMQTDVGRIHGYGNTPDYLVETPEEEPVIKATPQEDITTRKYQ